MRLFSTLLLFQFFSIQLYAQNGKELSISFLNSLSRNQYDSCYASLDTSINQIVTLDKLKQVWESMPRYVGEYKSFSNVIYEKTDSTEVTTMRCDFEKTKLDLKITHNKNKKISSLAFLPPKNNLAYQVPEYHDPSKFYETKATVKTGIYELPGILCVPNNITNPPLSIAFHY